MTTSARGDSAVVLYGIRRIFVDMSHDNEPQSNRRQFMKATGSTALVGGLAGCLGSLQGGGGGPITVGVALPFSGDLADFGEPMTNALNVALDHINEAGGPNGRELELVTEDTATESTQGVNAAQKLIETDDASIVIGAVSSGVTISIAQSVTIPGGVMQISPASSSPTISTLDDDDLVWRTRVNDRFQAVAMGRIIEAQGGDSAAVLYINNDFGQALANTFENSFAGETVAAVAYESGQSSYQQQLSQLYEDDPDWVAFAGYPESGTTILKQWNEGGYGGNWVLHTSVLNEDFVNNVGTDIVSGMFAARPLTPTGQASNRFKSDYSNRYPDANVFTPYSWNSYDALMSWALAVHHAGTADSAEAKQSMRPVSNPPGQSFSYEEFGAATDAIDDGDDINYDGPSGSVDYDKNGEVAADIAVIQISEQGEFEETRTIEASELTG